MLGTLYSWYDQILWLKLSVNRKSYCKIWAVGSQSVWKSMGSIFENQCSISMPKLVALGLMVTTWRPRWNVGSEALPHWERLVWAL